MTLQPYCLFIYSKWSNANRSGHMIHLTSTANSVCSLLDGATKK